MNSASDTVSATQECRLCAAQANFVFSKLVLRQLEVRYFQCQACKCLQTELPYWLENAYAAPVSDSDTGYVLRNLEVIDAALFLRAVLRLRSPDHIVDYGGGLGLVARTLREMGASASVLDPYCTTPFADLNWDGQDVTLLIASEVLEHLANPAVDLQEIFKFRPKYVYARTALYHGQGREWDYIGAEHGQHVFLYSPEGIGYIAARFGYRVMMIGEGQQFFWREHLSGTQRHLINVGLRRAVQPFLRIFGSTFR